MNPALRASLVTLLLLAGVARGLPSFQDRAQEAGVAVQHAGEVHPDFSAWPASPEVEGSGACWFDGDGDGYDDLYIVNQQWNRHNPAVGAWADSTDPTNKLFRNDGDGTFTDVTEVAGVAARIFGYGCSAADYDADGCIDLFVSGFGGVRLFHNNCDGTFGNATSALGVPFRAPEGCGRWPCMSTSSAWADYDHDGWPDLYVGNYVNTNLTDTQRGPSSHVAQVNWLFHNRGDGTFDEVGAGAGVAGNPTDDHGSKTLGVAWTDYDLDGWADLVVANDETPLNLYHNEHDGTFTDRAVDAGIADTRANMGIATGDYDHDGYPDVFLTHFAQEQAGFYRNLGGGTFEDRSGEDDLGADLSLVGWGTAFEDIDRDGWLDLLAANGHTDWASGDYAQPVKAWRSAPGPPGAAAADRVWTDVTSQLGSLGTRAVHRGAAFSDMLLHGDLDIALVNNDNATSRLLRADLGGAGQGHWLDVQALDLASPNRFALGARIVVVADGVAHTREVQAGASYLSQSSLTQRFGLGGATQATITVHWPAGGSTTVGPVGADQAIRVRSDGTWTNDSVSPFTTAAIQGTAGNHGWWRSQVSVAISATDRASTVPSGIAATEMRVDGAAWQAAGPLSFGEGEHVLAVRSTDLAGNVEPARAREVRVDLTPPEVTWSASGTAGMDGWWTSTHVAVALGTRDALSGAGPIAYRVDGGAWTAYDVPFLLTEDGVHHVEFTAEDVAGNRAADAFDVKLDHTAPQVAIAHPGPGDVLLGDTTLLTLGAGPAVVVVADDAERVVEVRAPASDGTSGVREVRFLVDGVAVAALDHAPFAWTWPAGDAPAGLHVLSAVATDGAGNVDAVTQQVVLVPATPQGIGATLAEGPAAHVAEVRP